MTESTTRIKGADWVVGWDDAAGDHRYLRDTDVVFRGRDIVHVGGEYDGDVDTEIDGSRLMVMPGLISTHTHLNGGPFAVGFLVRLARTPPEQRAAFLTSPSLT